MIQQIIQNRDCIEGMMDIPSSSVDLVIADSPYGLGKDYGNTSDFLQLNEWMRFTDQWLNQAQRILKPRGSIYCFMGVEFIADLFIALRLRFKFNSWITWHFTQGEGRTRGFSHRHEDILFFTKTTQFKFNLEKIRVPNVAERHNTNLAGANPGDVWQFPHIHYHLAEKEEHPTQKPLSVIRRIIHASSLPGDTICDPFSGSGTVAKCCQEESRNCIAFEINPAYCQMAKDRLAKNQT